MTRVRGPEMAGQAAGGWGREGGAKVGGGGPGTPFVPPSGDKWALAPLQPERGKGRPSEPV